MAVGFLDISLLVLRLFVGAIFILHGLPKFKMTAEMAAGMKKSKAFIVLLGFVEMIAGLALILGFYSKVAGILLGLVMVGALWHKIAKWKVPFSTMNGTGWEFDLVLLGANLVLVAAGAGSISLDAFLGTGF
jgi:putative oxidoreductase